MTKTIHETLATAGTARPPWRSYLDEAAEYASNSLVAATAEGREHWRGQAEWALARAHKKIGESR